MTESPNISPYETSAVLGEILQPWKGPGLPRERLISFLTIVGGWLGLALIMLPVIWWSWALLGGIGAGDISGAEATRISFGLSLGGATGALLILCGLPEEFLEVLGSLSFHTVKWALEAEEPIELYLLTPKLRGQWFIQGVLAVAQQAPYEIEQLLEQTFAQNWQTLEEEHWAELLSHFPEADRPLLVRKTRIYPNS